MPEKWFAENPGAEPDDDREFVGPFASREEAEAEGFKEFDAEEVFSGRLKPLTTACSGRALLDGLVGDGPLFNAEGYVVEEWPDATQEQLDDLDRRISRVLAEWLLKTKQPDVYTLEDYRRMTRQHFEKLRNKAEAPSQTRLF